MANSHLNSSQDLKSTGMNSGPVSSACNVTVKVPALRFLTVQFARTSKTFRNLNLFYIHKNLDAVAGKVKNASHLRNGTLLVEVLKQQAFEGHSSEILSPIKLKGMQLSIVAAVLL